MIFELSIQKIEAGVYQGVVRTSAGSEPISTYVESRIADILREAAAEFEPEVTAMHIWYSGVTIGMVPTGLMLHTSEQCADQLMELVAALSR